MMNRNNFKIGDICHVLRRDLDGTIESKSDYTAIIVEKLDEEGFYHCLHKNKLRVFYCRSLEKISRK